MKRRFLCSLFIFNFLSLSYTLPAEEHPRLINIRQRPVANPEIPAYLGLEVWGVDFEFEVEVFFTDAYIEVSRDGELLETYGRGTFSSGSSPILAGSVSLTSAQANGVLSLAKESDHCVFQIMEIHEGKSRGGTHRGWARVSQPIPNALLDPIPDGKNFGEGSSFDVKSVNQASPAKLFEITRFAYSKQIPAEGGRGWTFSENDRHEVVMTVYLEFGKESPASADGAPKGTSQN